MSQKSTKKKNGYFCSTLLRVAARASERACFSPNRSETQDTVCLEKTAQKARGKKCAHRVPKKKKGEKSRKSGVESHEKKRRRTKGHSLDGFLFFFLETRRSDAIHRRSDKVLRLGMARISRISGTIHERLTVKDTGNWMRLVRCSCGGQLRARSGRSLKTGVTHSRPSPSPSSPSPSSSSLYIRPPKMEISHFTIHPHPLAHLQPHPCPYPANISRRAGCSFSAATTRAAG